jgi:LemA protein
MGITAIILIIVLLLLIIVAGLYNRFVRLRTRVKEAWSDIDVQLKRRYDLIPNLIETVKGYAVHEKETLQNVTEARTKAMGAHSVEEQA